MNDPNRKADIEDIKKEFKVDPDILGPFYDFETVKVKHGEIVKEIKAVATEVPFTIMANDIEVVTLLCLPTDLKELATGFLYSSSFINSIEDLKSYALDPVKWVAHCELAKSPDPEMMRKRLYTSGCGKGVMYASMDELVSRHPLKSDLKINKESVMTLAGWLQHCSSLYRITGGVQTAAISLEGQIPGFYMDDVGRHNAVDKAIGRGLIEGIDFAKCVLVTSGRTSSEILQKARRANIAVTISRGAPTHQTILRGRDMGITVVGFARGGTFNIYSHDYRIAV